MESEWIRIPLELKQSCTQRPYSKFSSEMLTFTYLLHILWSVDIWHPIIFGVNIWYSYDAEHWTVFNSLLLKILNIGQHFLDTILFSSWNLIANKAPCVNWRGGGSKPCSDASKAKLVAFQVLILCILNWKFSAHFDSALYAAALIQLGTIYT